MTLLIGLILLLPSSHQIERVFKRETGAKVLEAWPNDYFVDQVRGGEFQLVNQCCVGSLKIGCFGRPDVSWPEGQDVD